MRLSLLTLLVLAGCPRTKDAEDTSTGVTSPGGNEAPIANAGTDQALPGDSVVTLTGAASTDPEGTALTFYWSFDHVPTGSQVQSRDAVFSANHSADAVNTSFTPDAVGTYVVSLVVRDAANKASSPDFVIITVEEPSTLPVARAGNDVAVSAGTNVTLDGSASYDPQGRPLTYSWTVTEHPAGSSSSLSDATSATPSITPDLKGVYVATLVVNNGLAASAGDSVTITATGDDNAPVANAGSDIATEDCTSVPLNCGGSSDPDGDTLTYFWEIQSKPAASTATPAVSFSDRTSATPTFWPDQAGTYSLSCSVTDGTNWATPDVVQVVASERAVNTAPAVNAGADQAVDAGSATCEPSGYVWNCDECAAQTITLGSDAIVTDVDGDPLVYTWAVESGDATISSPNAMTTQVVLEGIEPEEAGACATEDYRFRLTVTDCTGAQTSDTVRFQATCCGVEDSSSR